MNLELYDAMEKGIDVTQTLYRIQQIAPPQIIDQSSSKQQSKQKNNNKQKKYNHSYSSESEDSLDQDSSFDSNRSNENNQQIQFLYNNFSKVIPKKSLEFKMVSEGSTKSLLYAKNDVKNNQWLIYMNEPSNPNFNEKDPQFILQIRSNKKQWVLWSTNCEKCYQKKQCQPYTNRRQWLMYIMHDIEKDTENAVHVLQILVPRSEDDLKQQIICPKTMDKKNSRYDYNNKDFTYYEFQSKDNSLPEDCFYIRTKFPNWSENLKSWVIDSYGRIKAPSKRNFQLLFDQINFASESNLNQPQYEDKDYFPIFQMGKSSSNNYIVDFRHPLSFIQSFAIALCTNSWQSKL